MNASRLQEREEARQCAIDAKLQQMMRDQSVLAAAVDDVISGDPYSDVDANGSSNLGNDLARILMGDDIAKALMQQLLADVTERMRMDAETEVNHDAAQREAARNEAAADRAEARS
jgi:hypothetical protein